MLTLVTGATGFIGRHAVRALIDAGQDVACLVRKSGDRRGLEGARFVEGDLSDEASIERALEGAHAILHLASMLKVPWKPEFRTVNIGGTEAIARAASRRQTPPVLIVVSSLAAAGPTSSDRPHREEDEARPISRYGKMKLDAERAALAFADRVPITVVRPPMVLGEGDRYGLELFKTIARGVHVIPSFADHRVSMVHVADLSCALIAAIDRGARGSEAGLYYVADDRRPAYAELGAMVAQAMNTKAPRVVRLPRMVSGLGALGGELVARIRDEPTIFNLDKWREATAGSWICDASRAKKELGFAPHAIEERLAQTAEWYEREGWITVRNRSRRSTSAVREEGPANTANR